MCRVYISGRHRRMRFTQINWICSLGWLVGWHCFFFFGCVQVWAWTFESQQHLKTLENRMRQSKPWHASSIVNKISSAVYWYIYGSLSLSQHMTTITNTVFLLVTLGKPIKSENNWVLHCIWLLFVFICYFSNAWHPTVYFKWLRISFIIHIYFIFLLPLNLWSNNSNVTYLNWCLYNVFGARFNGAQCISQTDGIQIKLKITFWERKTKKTGENWIEIFNKTWLHRKKTNNTAALWKMLYDTSENRSVLVIYYLFMETKKKEKRKIMSTEIKTKKGNKRRKVKKKIKWKSTTASILPNVFIICH